MDAESWRITHELLASCCQSLFENLGVKMAIVADLQAAPARKGERLATFVGYSGAQLRGSIAMDVPTTLIARLHPSTASAEKLGNDDLCDWLGELANQLLGRLKNGLARHGVTLQMSTPSTVWGEMVHARRTRAQGSTELEFATGEDLVIVYFDGLALLPLDITKSSAADFGDPPAEGDMMMLL
jgi:CheY-specific phosphatase CheX